MASKDDCIRAAARAGATPEEATALVNAMFDEKRALAASGVVAGAEKQLAARVGEMAEASKIQALLRRKQTALNIRCRVEVDGAIAAMRADGAGFDDAMTALMVGSGGRFAGARVSVSNRKGGIVNAWAGGMLRELEAIEGALPLLKGDRDFGVLAHREMLEPGSTGNPMARQVAEVFTRHMEAMRVRLNDAGANIGRIENYAPQSHSPERLLRAGETAWTRYVAERLDFERSFPGVTDAAERMSILSEVYHTIVTGQNRQMSGAEQGAPSLPRNLATSLGKERVLHFSDAAGALEYHENFGSGTIVQGVLGQMQKRSGRLALMEVFGPNPEAMLKSLVEGERRRLRVATEDEIRGLAKGKQDKRLGRLEKRLDAARAAGDEAGAAKALEEWQREVITLRGDLIAETGRLWDGKGFGGIANYYAVLSGDAGTPVNPTFARWSANVRGLQAMAKLGGAVLSAFADVFVKAVNLRHNGENLLSTWKNALDIRLQALQSKERVAFGRALGVYSNTLMGEIYSRFDIVDQPSGAVSRAMNTFFRLSGLDAWTEGHKAAYTMHLSHRLGSTVGDAFGTINADFAASLRKHGLDTRWDLLRRMAQDLDGEPHILPERAYALDDADFEAHIPENYREGNAPVDPEKREIWQRARERELMRARRDTATSLMGYYADETKYAVLEPDEKTRAFMYGGSRPGTAWGEMRRFMLQFKSFPVSYSMRFLGEGRWNRASLGRYDMEIPGMIHAAVGGLGFGYLAVTAKDLVKGRQPRDPEKLETWMASFMQAGGAGILGDFFLGSKDRFGNQAASSLLGPLPTAATKLFTISGQLARGEAQAAGEDALRLVLDNTPFINLWYTRMALDYLLLFHIREALSPGTLARSERKLREEYNQRYLEIGGVDFTPSKTIARGGGFRGGAINMGAPEQKPQLQQAIPPRGTE